MHSNMLCYLQNKLLYLSNVHSIESHLQLQVYKGLVVRLVTIYYTEYSERTAVVTV